MEAKIHATPLTIDASISPEEWMFEYETHGKELAGSSDPRLLEQYNTGKAMRDWWTKEIGWWKKNCVFVPEEFTKFLRPECFVELFRKYPATHLVRYFYDNDYDEDHLSIDLYYRVIGLDRERGGWRVIK